MSGPDRARGVRLATLAVVVGLSLVVYGGLRWRSEYAVETVARRFTTALLQCDADTLAESATAGLSRHFASRDFAAGPADATVTVQRVRLDGDAALARVVVRHERSRVTCDLHLVRERDGWRVDSVGEVVTFPPQTPRVDEVQLSPATGVLPDRLRVSPGVHVETGVDAEW